MYITELFIKSDELSITATLNKAVEQFKNKVKFGSYPSLDSNYYRVRLVLEGEKEEHVAEAKTFLLNNLPDDSVTQFDRDPLTNAWQKLSALAERKPHIAASLKTIEEALTKYTLGRNLCWVQRWQGLHRYSSHAIRPASEAAETG
ncbi:hypothetical protein MTO96_000589 [Rhipicephalus appendiculatus]